MWFTIIMLAGPVFLPILDVVTPGSNVFFLLAGFWALASIVLVPTYWIARVWRRAWRDGDRRADARVTD
jgi:hypothetical protein